MQIYFSTIINTLKLVASTHKLHVYIIEKLKKTNKTKQYIALPITAT